jgi:hypothetical protein
MRKITAILLLWAYLIILKVLLFCPTLFERYAFYGPTSSYMLGGWVDFHP